ncbi:MAG: DNA ligase D [Thermoleophilia bacterium]
MGLDTYRNKRHFGRSPEPAGAAAGGERSESGGGLYVVQKHAATRLHYDFRLELDGVLVSWAVPKGPSLDPEERRLAVRVEDHPLEYAGFEGTIPAGEYGAGTVLLWDRGEWQPEGNPREALQAGELKFQVRGEKLAGGWALVKMGPRSPQRGQDEWLLLKRRDEYAVPGSGAEILEQKERSVASGRSLDEIGRTPTLSVWHSDRPAGDQTEVRPAEEFRLNPEEVPGARKSNPPRFLKPQLAVLVEQVPGGEGWLHEMKLDGYRVVSHLEGGRVRMLSRNGGDWTTRYAPIAEELTALGVASAVVDGEVAVQLSDGTTSFQALQQDLGEGRTDRLLYFVFDLPYLAGYDLTGAAIQDRKELLRRLVERAGRETRLRFSDHIQGDGPTVLEQACSFGLEGILSKKKGSPYRPGARSPDWLKAKCHQRQEFVVGGYTAWAGGEDGIGALLLGVWEPEGLRYVGKVGTGFTEKQRRELAKRLAVLRTEGSPFAAGRERVSGDVRWVRPELVVEVAFGQWTADGEIRHSSFQGVREDQEPEQVEREAPELRITTPDRVYWPDEGITKRDLIAYYRHVAEWIMPHVSHRPLAMLRCPDGLGGGDGEEGGPCFFHKHAGSGFPGPFERVEIAESEGRQIYLALTEPAGLAALAQMGVLEIHVWGSRHPDVEHPDMLVFDLDPDPAAGWAGAREAARLVRLVLAELGLQSFAKLTGGKGVHVVVPVLPEENWEGVKVFSRAVAERVVARAPDRFTSSPSKERRRGKTFVDYLRNSRGATSIATYSTRATAHATVAVPVRWDELGGQTGAGAYTVKNLKRRLSGLRSDPWEGYFEAAAGQKITEEMKRELGLPGSGPGAGRGR